MITPRNEIDAYYDGLREGVYMYAYMKDGTYYVGTTGRTLKQAYKDIEDERTTALERNGYTSVAHTAEN
jgi:hypothetical protein